MAQSLKSIDQAESYGIQRRRILFFLLQQVPHSRNFSPLVRAMAGKQAFETVMTAYDRASRVEDIPLDCAHVWGRALAKALHASNTQV